MLSNIIEFIARTHLVVLHFPIALIISAAIVESTRLFHIRITRRSVADHFRPCNTASVMFVFAFVSTAVAITTGILLGFNETAAVDLHRILGIASGVLIVMTAIALLIALKKASFKPALVYLAFLCSSAIAVAITGHLGGDLTHGSGFLTDPLKQIFAPQSVDEPEPLTEQQLIEQSQALNIPPAAIQTYNIIIQPLFDYSCIKCHGPKKQKGDVRLDSLAYTLDTEAAMVEPGDPDASEIVYRIELPPKDEDAMPPIKKAHPLTPSQVESVRDWITSLAP